MVTTPEGPGTERAPLVATLRVYGGAPDKTSAAGTVLRGRERFGLLSEHGSRRGCPRAAAVPSEATRSATRVAPVTEEGQALRLQRTADRTGRRSSRA
jgi:hypothetical protein